ncbi:MAG: amino acid adenylation domain-containing protein [Hydrogenophaga sp.]|uniref:non-ribosomal peptide synthetase n=1 Tax=Hydrogenophaga sp. TaxID=1904254 RepID=UPI001DE99D18|nr:amino acid adenylation domain-containing protein [Hydrogenophaga sp.]MBX3611476.1 amino acid adenylation domain-containing protein [Hydrogenophaga sp.]
MSEELTQWIADLRAQGVQLWEEGGQLRFRAPSGALSAQARERLAAHRDALIALLADRGRHEAVAADAGELVERLARLDVRLSVEGEKLNVSAPKGVLTPTLRDELGRRKEEVVTYLIAQRPAVRAPAGPALVVVPRHAEMPVSHTQQRLWFLRQVDPSSNAYNIPAVLRLVGPLDQTALERAFDLLLMRHEGLRTRFVTVNGEPRCVVEPQVSLQIERIDVSHLDGSVQVAASDAAMAAIVQRPFDLSRAPLLHVGLITEAPDRFVLALALDHIVSDGLSMGIFMAEFQAIYNSLVQGREPTLAPLPVQYLDYAEWERETFARGALQSHADFWKSELEGLPTLLQLPTDRPRPPVQTSRGDRCLLLLPPALSQRLKAFARAEGATLYMVLMTAFQTLLHRYSGETDFAIGTAIANRNRSEVEQVIGFFANNLVMRADLHGSPSVRGLMARVRERALKAYQHQAMPFDMLVEQLGVKRELDHPPLFQVLFVLQHLSISTIELHGLRTEAINPHVRSSRFDLAVDVFDAPAGLHCYFEFNTDLFDRATIERMMAHYERLLQALMDTPDARIGDLPLLTPAEESQLLVGWNATDVAYPREQTLHGLFEAQVARTPEATALCFGEGTLSYAELNARANRLAHHLRAQGAGPGALVGVWIERGPDMVVALLGVLKAGAAYVPLDPAFPRDRLDYMMEDAELRLVVSQASLAVGLPAGVQGVCLDTDAAMLAGLSPLDPPASAQAGDLAYVIYTSGSTGRPKGVMLEHRSVVNFLLSMQRQPGISAGDRFVAVTTLSFDIAGLELHGPLTVGGTVVLAARADALDGVQLARLLQRHEATLLQATPATWRLLLDSGWTGRPGLKMLCGGEGLPRELADKLVATGGQLWNMYGPTETTIWSTLQHIASTREGISIGRPIANTQVYVLEPSGLPAPIGVGGELCIGGDGLARGYRKREELTAEKFVTLELPGVGPTRVYRTGDIVRWRADGRLEFVGRRDHQVKVRGFRIELGEIETVLSRHEGIKGNVVHVREDTPGDQRLVAYVVPEPGVTPQADAMRATLRAQLPEYMVPNQFVVLPTFPLTPNGKVDRKALPAPQAPEPDVADDVAEALMTPVQRQVAALWRSVLKQDRVGLHANFFDIGGHSLLLVRLQAAIKREFGQEIALVELFQRTTVASQAERLSAPVASNAALERARARAARQIQG